MKTKIITTAVLSLFILTAKSQNVFPKSGSAGIGTTTPNMSAILDVDTIGKGVLIPRMTYTQRDAIKTPATSLLLYQTDNNPGYYYFDGIWKPVTPSAVNQIQFQKNNLFANGNNYAGSTTIGDSNTIVGAAAFILNTTGSSNSVFGNYAMALNTTGYRNTAMGYRALMNNGIGYANTANGFSTLSANYSGNNNTANGFSALKANYTGNNNTATGYEALFSNTTASNNTADGYQALHSNTAGNTNVAIGFSSLYYNTTQNSSVAVGSFALYKNGLNATGFQGNFNTALGGSALYSNTTGNSNLAVGYTALNYNTSGSANTATGGSALYFHTSGSGNTAVGANALKYDTIGSNNTALGYSADVSVGSLTNAMALGYQALVNGSNKVVVGNASVKVIGGQVGWSTFSDGRFKINIRENVPGLAFINKLKAVTYNLDLKKFDQFLGRKDVETSSRQADYADGEKKIRTGFIAQDVEKSAKELNYDFDGVNHPQDDKDNYSLVYADFVVPLVKAVQELSQQNEKLVADMQQMKDEIAMLKATKTVTSSNTDAAVINDKAVLGQNQPNPFGSQTLIPLKLPQHFSNASVVITETATGRILKTIAVTANTTQLTIDAGSFAAGTLTYALYVDGKRTDTKQMVHISTK